MTIRTALPDFALRNTLYAGASVDVWTVNTSLVKTATRATLYAGPTGATTLTNPQTLDSAGKWAQPVYVDRPVVMTVTPVSGTAHDTGISDLLPRWRGVWASGTTYFPNERVRHPTGHISYVVNSAHVSGVFSTDLANGLLEYELDLSDLSTPITVNVKSAPYGAVGDGTTDDTAAIQAAIDYLESVAGVSQGGGVLNFPAGDYKVTAGLTVTKSFIRLVGTAPQGARLVFYDMTGEDWITFGGIGITGIRRGGIENIALWGGTGNTIVQNANGSTSGASIKLENTYDMFFDRLAVENTLCGFDIGRSTNATTIANTIIVPNQAGSLYGINWWCPGDNSYRSDVLRVNNVVVTGQWSDAVGVNWQGFCNTLIGCGLRILHLSKGLKISNPAASASYFPSFLNISDLEMEGFKVRALEITGGADFKITNSDINNLSGNASQGSADNHAVYITADSGASITRGVSFNNTRIGGCRQNGIYSDSRDLQLTGVIFYSTSGAGSGSHAVVRLGANTRKAIITNMVAEEFGGAGLASYAVQVDSGATGVSIAGLDASGAVTGAILDSTTEKVSATNVIASGTTLQGLGHHPGQRRTMTRYTAAGAIVESVVYNAGTGASTWARDQVSTGTANSYVIRGLNDNAGSPYYQIAGGPAVTVQYQDFTKTVFRTTAAVAQFAIGELLPSFADDAAAATGGIVVGGWYYNTTSSRERQRRS